MKIDPYVNYAEHDKPASMFEQTASTIKFADSLVRRVVFLGQGQYLVDTMLKSEVSNDDNFYLDRILVKLLVPRGLTFFTDVENDFECILRRGLQKFFSWPRANVQTSPEKAKLNQRIRERIGFKAEVAFDQCERLMLFELRKLSGHNAQISFHLRTKQWVIASKNVCVLAADPQELDLPIYESKTYAIAKLIGLEFFNLLNSGLKAKVAELRQFLGSEGITFVGEFCGNSSAPHLIESPRELVFYAAVKNASTLICLSPLYAKSLFDYFGLRSAELLGYREVRNKEEFFAALDAAATVYRGQFDTVGEGVVVYTVAPGSPGVDEPGRSEVVGLTKVKTLHYSVFRNLRENLNRFLADVERGMASQADAGRYFDAFAVRVAQLVKADEEEAAGQDYFLEVGVVAFRFAGEHLSRPLVFDNFAKFLRLARIAAEESRSLELGDFAHSGTTQTTFTKVEANLKVLPPISGGSGFGGSRGSGLGLSGFGGSGGLGGSDPGLGVVGSGMETGSVTGQGLGQVSAGTAPISVKVFVAVSIPGCGKTTFFENLACRLVSEGYWVFQLSSDQLTAYLISREMLRDSSLNYREAAEKVEGSRGELFFSGVSRACGRISRLNFANVALLIDKNFNFSGLTPLFARLRASLGRTRSDFWVLRISSALPFSGAGRDFELSLSIFLACFLRLQRRPGHITTGHNLPLRNLELALTYFFNFEKSKRRPMPPCAREMFLDFFIEELQLEEKIRTALGPAVLAMFEIFENLDTSVRSAKFPAALEASGFLPVLQDFVSQNKQSLEGAYLPPIQLYLDSLERGLRRVLHIAPPSPPPLPFDYTSTRYLGIFFSPPEIDACLASQADILASSYRRLKKINPSAPSTDPERSQALSELASLSKMVFDPPLRFPSEPHLTIEYLDGRIPSEDRRSTLESLALGSELCVTFDALVYVPNRLMFLVSFSPLLGPPPHHLTFFSNPQKLYQFKHSNDILDLVSQKVDLKKLAPGTLKELRLQDLHINTKNLVLVLRIEPVSFQGIYRSSPRN